MRDRVSVKETNGHLLIRVQWRSGYLLPLIATFVWGLFAVVFGVTAARASGLVPGVEGEPSIVQLVTNLLLLCMVSYSLTAYWINATVVDVCTLDLRVYADPLPFPYPRRKRIPSSKIRQLYVVKNREYHDDGSTSVKFHLYAELINGNRLELIRHLTAAGKDIARVIEEKIEDFLVIEDVYVEGEHLD